MTVAENRVTVTTDALTYVVQAEAVRIGEDVLVYIWGGDRPHIGAVATGIKNILSRCRELVEKLNDQLQH